MLSEIVIEDFAIIDKLRLRLDSGLNVLTGETGAGKSVVIDAISYVLGARGGPSLVRNGARLARVEAIFEEVPLELLALLDEWNVVAEGRTVVLARETTASGRNTYRVNGHMVTQCMLKSVGCVLVEIHGQHEAFRLLEPSHHIDLLDRLGGEELETQRCAVGSAWNHWKSLRDERAALVADACERQRCLEWLSFEADEIESMRLIETPDELETLEAERLVLANADRILSQADQALTLLDGADGDGGIRTGLACVARLLSQIESVDAHLAPMLTAARALSAGLDELRRDLGRYADGVEADPARLEEVNERVGAIQRLQKKYGPTVSDIVAHGRRARAELETLEVSDSRTRELDALVEAAGRELARTALELSSMRKSIARGLEQEVAEQLAGLEMPNTRFSVCFAHDLDDEGLTVDAMGEMPLRVGSGGFDRVEFLISANPGQPLQPLARVASGGETSRVMLAMQSVLARVNPVDTMIFDEIDAGLGGVAAEAVATRLRKIAQIPRNQSRADFSVPAEPATGRDGSAGRQVICVTHLPLVAAAASVHWSLSKQCDGEITTTRARGLSAGERVEEIARMMAGRQASATTCQQAEEMLRWRDGGRPLAGRRSELVDRGDRGDRGMPSNAERRRASIAAGRRTRVADCEPITESGFPA